MEKNVNWLRSVFFFLLLSIVDEVNVATMPCELTLWDHHKSSFDTRPALLWNVSYWTRRDSVQWDAGRRMDRDWQLRLCFPISWSVKVLVFFHNSRKNTQSPQSACKQHPTWPSYVLFPKSSLPRSSSLSHKNGMFIETVNELLFKVCVSL